eukprot:TRINITY_DN54489_c0_g1_i1.p1 TRINITY_DN54489_c0_g1~~TRINITY_DN54489_c0_g1_i1.p1  ORF type:complete len:719 (+),score=88.08 TRINITY_DN54489_c0_g1_i1:237-2393(+)
MEFVTVVAPHGPLWKAWVAAHWEKRLRRHDYNTVNIKAVVSFAMERVRSIALGRLGSLLVGFCRLYSGKSRFLDETAHEVRIALRLSLDAGGSLPVVASKTEASLTWPRFQPTGEHGWEQQADLFSPGDSLGLPLDLLPEPEWLSTFELEAVLDEGRRHVAPIQLITLPDSPSASVPPYSFDSQDDAFGAPSQEDQTAMQAMEFLSSPQKRSQSEQWRGRVDTLGSVPLPPVDQHLGTGALRAENLLVQSGGDDHVLLPEPFQAMSASPMRAIGVSTPGQSPRRALDLDVVSDASGRETESRRRFSYLASMLDYAPLRDENGDDTDVDFVDEAHGADADVSVAADAEAYAKGFRRPQKRRRRCRQWLDAATEIPSNVYHDTSAITLRPSHHYDIYLPHASRDVGFTTSFSDIAPELAEFFFLAREVGGRRYSAQIGNISSSSALLPLGVGAFDALPSRVSSSPLPPIPTVMGQDYCGDVETHVLVPTTDATSEVRVGVPAEMGMAFDARSAEESNSGLGRDVEMEDLSIDVWTDVADMSDEADPFFENVGGVLEDTCVPDLTCSTVNVNASLRSVNDNHDLSVAPFIGPLRMPALSIVDATVAVSSSSPQKQRLVPRSETGVKLEDNENSNKSGAAPVSAQESYIRRELEVSTESTLSFLSLCHQPPADAKAAALRFVSLLCMQMDGCVSINQASPYDDISIGRGPFFDGFAQHAELI